MVTLCLLPMESRGLDRGAGEFVGTDPGAGIGDPRPNSNVAAQAFDDAATALGALTTIDLEQLPAGPYLGPIDIGSGITLAISTNAPDGSGIQSDPAAGVSRFLGYNTTSGGSLFARLDTNTSQPVESAFVEFSFPTRIVAWGAYVTGIGNVAGAGDVTLQIETADVESPPTLVATAFPQGGALFLGVTRPEAPFSVLRLRLSDTSQLINANLGIDDIRFALIDEQDGDGFGTAYGDCDDTHPTTYPGAPALCDGINNDCNDPLWPAVPAEEIDGDGDGLAPCAGDCNDGNDEINPSATEICNDIDDDCDTLTDEDESGEDSDLDGVHNLCDNCVFKVNPDQSDQDLDQLGDACDNCPADPGAAQDDYDLDGVGDACDNCVFDRNPGQSDWDNDLEGDHCDLDDDLIYIRCAASDYVEWQEEIGFGTWNLYTGDLGVLKDLQVYTQLPGSNPLASRECALSDPWFQDLAIPPRGEAAFYLTTGVRGSAESDLGTDSAGQPRPNANPCP